MFSISRCGVVVLAILSVMGCACNRSSQGASGAPSGVTVADDPKMVVAKINGRTITLGDLAAAPGGEQLFEVEQQRYQVRRQVIDQLIFKELVGAEAKKKEMTEEAWMASQVDAKVTPPSEADVAAFYEKNKEGMPPGTTLETIKPRIVDFMTRDQKGTLTRGVFDELKKNAKVEVLLQAPKKPKKQVDAKGPSRGPENAKVTIVEFSDFECPYCSRAFETVEEVMTAYAGKVRLVFRHFPLEFHKSAPKAAEASMCANEQGKFWEYHTALFKNQQKLEIADLKTNAQTLGLDAKKFDECLDSGRMAPVVQADMEAGRKIGISGTPAFFINGTMLSGAQPLEEFKQVIDAELAVN